MSEKHERTEEMKKGLDLIRRWRWMAKKYRGRGSKILEKRGLWAATEALTLDARAFILEQCARDLYRSLKGREVWKTDPEIEAMRTGFEEVRKQAEKLAKEFGFHDGECEEKAG